MTAKTLGQRITELLREFGVSEGVHSLSGGPTELEVTTWAEDRDGRRYRLGDGSVAMHTYRLQLHLLAVDDQECAGGHAHEWADVTQLPDADRRELCTVCGTERMVAR